MYCIWQAYEVIAMAISLQYIIRNRQGWPYCFGQPAVTYSTCLERKAPCTTLSIKMLPGSRCAKPTQITPQISSGADCYLMYDENTNLKYLENPFIALNWIEWGPLVGLHTLCSGRLTQMTLIWWVTFKLSNPLGCCEGLWEKMEGGLQPQNDAAVLCQSVCWRVSCVFISIC